MPPGFENMKKAYKDACFEHRDTRFRCAYKTVYKVFGPGEHESNHLWSPIYAKIEEFYIKISLDLSCYTC